MCKISSFLSFDVSVEPSLMKNSSISKYRVIEASYTTCPLNKFWVCGNLLMLIRNKSTDRREGPTKTNREKYRGVGRWVGVPETRWGCRELWGLAMGTVRQRNWGFVRGMRGAAAGISTATRCSWKKRMAKWREKVEAAESAHKSGHEQAASINSKKMLLNRELEIFGFSSCTTIRVI